MPTPHLSLVSKVYQGHTVTYREDGWFNATEAAAKFGKRPVDWLRLPDTDSYIGALCRQLRSEKISLLRVIRGGRSRPDGTWLHPKLAVPFARWLDDDFAVWCDMQIDGLIRGSNDWVCASLYQSCTSTLGCSSTSRRSRCLAASFTRCSSSFVSPSFFNRSNSSSSSSVKLDANGHDIEYNFKDPGHPLQLVFVCAMWLTGFDAPTVSTLYLDKPMQGQARGAGSGQGTAGVGLSVPARGNGRHRGTDGSGWRHPAPGRATGRERGGGQRGDIQSPGLCQDSRVGGSGTRCRAPPSPAGRRP